MITKTRPSETVETKVKEEPRLDWKKISEAALQILFVVAAMAVAHSLYIAAWRIMTGH